MVSFPQKIAVEKIQQKNAENLKNVDKPKENVKVKIDLEKHSLIFITDSFWNKFEGQISTFWPKPIF